MAFGPSPAVVALENHRTSGASGGLADERIIVQQSLILK
jgi:hypothetical protein